MQSTKSHLKDPSDMQLDAFQFLINMRFPGFAWCLLLSPEGLKKQLDALLMVADCQNRVSKLATLYTTVKEHLGPDAFAKLETLTTDYLKGTQGDRRVTKMKTLMHVIGQNPPSVSLITYFSDIKAKVGDADFQFVGDCFANCDNATFFYCELGSLMGWLPKSGYHVEMPSDSGTTLINRVYEGRVRLARTGIDAVSKTVEQWATDKWKAMPVDERLGRQWLEFWDQVATVWHASETYVENKDGSQTPVRDFRCAMLITLADMIQNGTPLVTEHRMIRMDVSPPPTTNNLFATNEDGDGDGDGSIQDEYRSHEIIRYSLLAFVVIQWRYDAGQGRFIPVVDLSDIEKDRPCPTIDMPNYHFADQRDVGFGCGTIEDYLLKFKSGEIPIEGALIPLIFDHPAVSGIAKHADRDYSSLYKVVSPDAGPVKHDRTSIEGFTLSTATGLHRPTLYQLYEAAKEVASKYGLVNNQEFFRTSEDAPRMRRDAPCDTGLRHVYISTLDEATKRCQAVVDKLNADNNAMVGGYVTRDEDRAISFMDRGFAEAYLAAKGRRDKFAVVAAKKRYCAEYPHNKVFHPQVPQAPTAVAKSDKKKGKNGKNGGRPL